MPAHRIAGDGEQVLDHEAFPAWPHDRMRQQGILISKTKQRVQNATVAHIDARRLDQPLAHVGMPGRQPANQQQIHQQVDVGSGGLHVHADVAGQLGHIELRALQVRQHGPKAAQRLRRNPPPELGDVPLQVGADEIEPPPETGCVIPGQEALRESATKPQSPKAIRGGLPNFQHVQRIEMQVAHPPGQRLARLPKQIHRSRAKQQV